MNKLRIKASRSSVTISAEGAVAKIIAAALVVFVLVKITGALSQ